MNRVFVCAIVAAACRGSPTPRSRGLEIEIDATWPGADSETLASAVTTPIERELARIPHIVQLHSFTTAPNARIVLDLEPGTELMAAMEDVQSAITAAEKFLPNELPMPPTYAAIGRVAERYAVADGAQLDLLANKMAMIPGVGQVHECGSAPRRLSIAVDATQLTASGLAITDLVAAVRKQSAGDVEHLRAMVIGLRSGVPIRLADVAHVDDASEPDCVAFDAHGRTRTIVVRAQTGVALDTLRESLAQLIQVSPLPPMHELMIELRDDAPHAIELRDTIGGVPGIGAFLVEQDDGGPHVYVASGDEVVAERLRALRFVASAGAATFVVEIEGADPKPVMASGRALAEHLATDHLLVATRGIRERTIEEIEIDRDAASRLGVLSTDLSTTLAARSGIAIATTFTTDSQIDTHLRVTPNSGMLAVHSADGAIVPLDAIAKIQTRSSAREIVHAGQFPAVMIYARGDEGAIKQAVAALALGPELHVTIEPR